MLRFTHNRTSKLVALGLSVAPCYWDKEAEMLTTDCPDRATLQSKIDCTLTGFQKKIKRLEALDIPVNFDTLFEVKTSHIAGITIDQGFNEEIERLEALGKIHSATKHRYALQVLEGYKPTSMAMEAIDLDYLKGLELYLRKRGNKDNSIATRFAIFKAIYNKAVKEGRIETEQNPFSLYQVGSLWAKTRKRAIDKEDIQRLIDLEITEGHTTEYRQLAKDLFLFSYFTAGMNFGDNKRQNLLLPTQNPETVILPAGAERLADYPEIQQDRICERRLYLSDSQPQCPSHATTDFQSDAQGAGKDQSGIESAGRTDRIGAPINDLCCPSYIRNRPETVRSKRVPDFRIVGALRPFDHANLPRFIRELANRRCRSD